nr:TetR family transcriptional regulator [Paraburkholderia mimosarum]
MDRTSLEGIANAAGMTRGAIVRTFREQERIAKGNVRTSGFAMGSVHVAASQRG